MGKVPRTKAMDAKSPYVANFNPQKTETQNETNGAK